MDNASAPLVDFPEFPVPASPFGQDSLFVDKYKDLFARFLKSNNLSEIIYQNYCGGKPVTLHAVLNNEAVEINYLTTLQAKNISKGAITEKDTVFFLFKKANRWQKSELPVEEIYNQGNCPFSEKVSDQEKEHLLQESKRHISFYKKPVEEKMLFFIEKDLEKVLSNPFYNDVKLAVEVTVQGQLTQNSSQPDNPRSFSLGSDVSGTYSNTEETPDIILKMVVDSKGRLTVKHVANPLYLKEYENKWEKEAQARGLEVNIAKLRNEVIQDFEHKETEYSFYQKFVQKTKALLNESIAGYTEAILATQKVVTHVWQEGTVNKGTWHTKDEEYTQWPEYMHMEPVTAGVTDGVIDEILGIKMAISAIYDIATDEEKRKALANVFTSEGIKQVYEGLMREAQEIYNDPERSEHFVGQTTIAVGTMFIGGAGFLSKAGKAVDAAEATARKLSTITNIKVNTVLTEIRKNELHNPKVLHAVQDFLSKIDPKTLNALADAPGFDKAIKEMSQQWSKFHGGKFVLEYASKRVGNGKTIKFEVETSKFGKQNLEYRRYDIQFEEFLPDGTPSIQNLELKNWTGFWGETIKNQFTKDLEKMNNLGDVKWIFNKKGINQDINQLRQNVIKNLKKDGIPIDELKIIKFEKVKQLFPTDDLLNRNNYLERLIENLNKPEIFKQIFEIVE